MGEMASGSNATALRVALVCNVVLAIGEPIAWCFMVFFRGATAFASVGLASLKYFTVLSNLLLGVASLLFAIYLVRYMREGCLIPRWALLLKLVATTAVTVTLMTVLLFLGPVFGYLAMFVGVNLWFHLVFPVMGIAEFVFLDLQHEVTFKESLLGVVPTLLYGIVYYLNIVINGVGERPYTNDWYGFTMFGVQYMPVVLVVMLLVTWVFALALRAGNKAMRKRR